MKMCNTTFQVIFAEYRTEEISLHIALNVERSREEILEGKERCERLAKERASIKDEHGSHGQYSMTSRKGHSCSTQD